MLLMPKELMIAKRKMIPLGHLRRLLQIFLFACSLPFAMTCFVPLFVLSVLAEAIWKTFLILTNLASVFSSVDPKCFVTVLIAKIVSTVGFDVSESHFMPLIGLFCMFLSHYCLPTKDCDKRPGNLAASKSQIKLQLRPSPPSQFGSRASLQSILTNHRPPLSKTHQISRQSISPRITVLMTFCISTK